VRRLLLLSALLLGAVPSSALGAVDGDAARQLAGHSVYVDPAVASVVDADRLAYAARVASRTADGARIKIAFVNVATNRLNAFRDRLYRQLELGDDGAVVIATPVAVAMRSKTLTPDQEAYILKADGRALKATPRRYTSAVAEMTYDVGLVIHNLRPNAVPRGLGADRNLATFSGRYPGEATGGVEPAAVTPTPAEKVAAASRTKGGGGDGGAPTGLIAGALVALGLAGGVLLSMRRPRRRRG
jgi:hypothetical protein